MSELIKRAAEFAKVAHGDQRRKYTNEPYWVHPEEVAMIITRHGFPEPVIAAAWLHDVLEDTSVSYLKLVTEFGENVADLVLQVTDASTHERGNRAVRRRIDRQYLAGADLEGQAIKCADIISNTRDIAANDPGFARVYLPEKKLLLGALTKVQETPIKVEAVWSYFDAVNGLRKRGLWKL